MPLGSGAADVAALTLYGKATPLDRSIVAATQRLVGTRTAGAREGAGRKVRVESARDRLPGCGRFLVGRCGVDRDDDRFPSAVGHDGKDRAADDVGGEQALPVGRPGSGTAKRRIGKVWMILALAR